MPYLILIIGLLLILLAAYMLGHKSKRLFGGHLSMEKMPPMQYGEAETLLQLAEMVESALAELDEKNRSLQKMINQYEEHRAAIEQRLEQLNKQLKQPQGNDDVPGKENPALHIHRQVYALSDRGSSVAEIAAALGLGRGEVQLILSLRNLKN
ncbi:MAG: hypothetical protein GX200_09770 [Firmicutes bacterium]|nr:hypothetical protein [Bacillota bacterium]